LIGVLGSAIPREVQIWQSGRIKTSEGGKWRPLTAEQTFFSDPPGFVWSARASFAGLLRVEVEDSYRNGVGGLDVKALPGVRLSSATGSDVDRGALLRFLAELVWMPAAMLAPYISWELVGDHTARATIVDHGLTEHAEFHFGEDGLVTRITAIRHKDAGTTRSALWPWVAMVSAYRRLAGGVLVPSRARVLWLLNGRAFGYFEAEVTKVGVGEYEPMRQV
jgi:hypothetical protein